VHYEDVRQWLNATFPGRWIGRGGPIAWSPRSPDLPPMFLFSVDTPEGAHLCSTSHDCQRLCVKASTIVTTVDTRCALPPVLKCTEAALTSVVITRHP
jgi:hypothetical protein